MTDISIKDFSKKTKDYSGFKIGKLKIKKLIGRKKYKSSSSPNWLALCECGNEYEISSNKIRNAIYKKYSPSCKECDKYETRRHDFVGEKIGKIKILKLIGKKQYNVGTAPLWLGLCECGNKKIFSSTTLKGALKQNYNLSCGCVIEEKGTRFEGIEVGHLKVLKKEKYWSIQMLMCMWK